MPRKKDTLVFRGMIMEVLEKHVILVVNKAEARAITVSRVTPNIEFVV